MLNLFFQKIFRFHFVYNFFISRQILSPKNSQYDKNSVTQAFFSPLHVREAFSLKEQSKLPWRQLNKRFADSLSDEIWLKVQITKLLEKNPPLILKLVFSQAVLWLDRFLRLETIQRVEDSDHDETMEDIIDEIPSSGVKNKDFQPKHEEEKTKENLESIGEGSDHSLLIIKELKNLDQNKVIICHVF